MRNVVLTGIPVRSATSRPRNPERLAAISSMISNSFEKLLSPSFAPSRILAVIVNPPLQNIARFARKTICNKKNCPIFSF